MTDFMCKLPFQIVNETLNRQILQFILTVIVIILTLLKDPSFSLISYSDFIDCL